MAELVKQAAEQLSDLVRGEIRLAVAEMTRKGKRAGIGAGMFGAAAIALLLALQALVATAIAAVAIALPVWAAALVAAGALLLVAGFLGLLGMSQTRRVTPLKPETAINGVKADVEAIRMRAHP
ncbi:phage holin family protein [Streptomyces sp. TP-A0874]|uniref:phage holin family protein n=1 Tax=Streptomyces sp. TP-A0874 TaxID=549819 RepID=UPI0008533284|nr:phage holin family protein [Streptomyces sp. TP-A0874]